MSAAIDHYSARRAELVARLERDRAGVADAFGAVQGKLRVAEALVGAVQNANRYRTLTGALAVMAVLSPVFARTWLRRAAWLIPVAIEAIRLTRGRQAPPQ